MATEEVYLLGHAAHEDERLARQALELAEESRALFNQIGLQPGARAIDIGCGPQGSLELLAERVGPKGTVVGLERNESTAQLARRFAAVVSACQMTLSNGCMESGARGQDSVGKTPN